MNNKVILFAPPCKPSDRYSHLLLNALADPVMPVRLRLAVKPHKLVGHFCFMKCVTRINGYYVVSYTAETKALNLIVLSSNTKKPIMLGRARVYYKQHEMVFDVDSFSLAINIVNFLDCYLPKDTVKLKTITTYNRFVFVEPSSGSRLVEYENYDALFTKTNMQLLEPDITYNQDLNLLEQQERQKMLNQHPLIETFTACTSDDGIDYLAHMLQIRLAIAKTISEGINCSMWDFFQSLATGELNP